MKEQRREPTWLIAKQALSHPDRIAMLAHVTGEGMGAGASELAEGVGLTCAKAEYHLLVLRNAGLIAPVDRAGGGYVAIAPGPGRSAA